MKKELFIELGKLQSISKMCNALYLEAKTAIKNILKDYEDGLVVTQEMGIPHTAVDFSDVDENDIPKQKVIDSLDYDKDGDTIVAFFSDGTKSTNFAFDDIAYLMEDILQDFEWEI